MAQSAPKPTTIVIDDFGGRLTRLINGDLKSGFAKYDTSFGYDPFSKPRNLTWLEQPTSILTTAFPIMGAKILPAGTTQNVYTVDSSGILRVTQASNLGNPNPDTSSVIGTVSSGSDTYNYGASIDYFRSALFVGSDSGIHSVNTDGSGDTFVGTVGNYKQNSFRPLRQFAGKLLFGNGNTFGAIDSTGTITSSIIGTGQGNLYSQINPPLPVEFSVTDLDVSVNFDYAMITASGVITENLTNLTSDRSAGQASSGAVFKWNGADVATTAGTAIPTYAVTALQTYLGNNMFFENDSFGSSISDGNKKILTMVNNKAPFSNATTTNGNFLSWMTPEVIGTSSIKGSLYYFGSLDQENPTGLYRLMRYTPSLANGFVYQALVNVLTNNRYSGINQSRSSVQSLGNGKHYLSVFEVNDTTTTGKLLKFFVTPTGTGTPQAGVYETQTQIFPKKMTVVQLRVYCEPTVSGNGFQLDLIDSDGSIIPNGTNNYTFAAGSDVTKMLGALERINFNPENGPAYALGLRITNTGTTNMTIKKIEVDLSESGK